MPWLTSQAPVTTRSAARRGSIAAASTAKAANGVAQASAKLASAQVAVSSAKQNNGAWRGSTGASAKPSAEGDSRLSGIGRLLARDPNTLPQGATDRSGGQCRASIGSSSSDDAGLS